MNKITMSYADEGKEWIDRYREINRAVLFRKFIDPPRENGPGLIKRTRHHRFKLGLQKDLKRLKWRRKHDLP